MVVAAEDDGRNFARLGHIRTHGANGYFGGVPFWETVGASADVWKSYGLRI